MRTTIDPIPAIISKNAKKDKNVVEKQPTTKKTITQTLAIFTKNKKKKWF